MSEQTKIAWCDSTINFWEGCTKVSAGCAYCYAEARDKRFTGGLHWGKGAPRRKSKSAVKDALAYNKKPLVCDHCGTPQRGAVTMDEGCANPACESHEYLSKLPSYHRRRIFSLSLGDWLDEEVPIEWLAEMLDTIRQCDQVTWILCTKRPENWHSRISAAINHCSDETGEWLEAWTDCRDMPERGDFPLNIILLASVENQAAAEARLPALFRIPAAAHGVSCEPLLGPVDLTKVLWSLPDGTQRHSENTLIENISDHARECYPEVLKDLHPHKINWIIAGGESGPNARPCEVDWIRALKAQVEFSKGLNLNCSTAMFVKQLGAAPIEPDPEHDWLPVPNIRDKKGGDPAEWPADLRVQEWPKGGAL